MWFFLFISSASSIDFSHLVVGSRISPVMSFLEIVTISIDRESTFVVVTKSYRNVVQPSIFKLSTIILHTRLHDGVLLYVVIHQVCISQAHEVMFHTLLSVCRGLYWQYSVFAKGYKAKGSLHTPSKLMNINKSWK